MSHTVLTFCRRCGRTTCVGFDQDGGDRVDPSPRDLNYNTCAKSDLSEVDLPIIWRRVEAQGASDLHRTNDTRFIANARSRRSSSDGGSPSSSGPSSRSSTHLKLHQMAGKICGRTPRSRSDRTAIVARSSRDRGSFIVELMPRSRRTVSIQNGRRKFHDRSPIASRSWLLLKRN